MQLRKPVWVVVFSVAALVAAFVGLRRFGGTWLVPDFIRVQAEQTKSKDNVRSLILFLRASDRGVKTPLPVYEGKSFLLWFVAAIMIDRRDARMLGLLFSPADRERSLAKAGGIEAYRDVTLESLRLPDPARDRLTSYAGPRRSGVAAAPPANKGEDGVPLIADLAFPDGAIVGFAGGKSKWLTREELGLGPADPLIAGAASKSPILRQLTSE